MQTLLDQNPSIINDIEAYQNLQGNINPNDKLRTENLKLQIIKQIELKLKNDIQFHLPAEVHEEALSINLSQTNRKKITYYILLILGIILDTTKNFVFGYTLITLIPGLSPLTQILLTMCYLILGAILFYGFEIALLKKSLGVLDIHTNLHQIINTQIEQIQAVKTINRLLSSISALSIDNQKYSNYVTITNIFNQDLQAKYSAMQPYEQSFFKKALMFAVLAFGVISKVASSYFLMSTILSAWAASIVGTPLGWLIIILAIAVELGFYKAMGATGVIQLMNTDLEDLKVLKNELYSFNREYPTLFFQRVTSLKLRTEQKVLQDAQTQTEDIIIEYTSLAL